MLAPPPLAKGTVPGDGLSITMASSHATALAEGGELFAEVTVAASTDLSVGPAQAVSMVIVLDHSGSMAGAKLEHARAAALKLINSMADDDQLAVVAFGSSVEGSEPVRLSQVGRQQLTNFVNRVSADGATNLSAGLNEGYRLVSTMGGARRLVLISDGQPTAGDTSLQGLSRLVDQVHGAGVSVTALGVGYDFDSRLMATLAERGGGLTGSLDDAARLSEVLALELGQARTVAARNVTLTLSPGPGVSIEEVPGRMSERVGNSVQLPLRDFRPGDRAVAYVRLRTNGMPGERATLLTAQVQWNQAAGARTASAGALSLPVVARQEDFDTSRSEVLFAAGVRALGSTKMVAAAEALERGDNEGAVSLLQAARSIFGMSANALAGEVDVTRQMEARATLVKGDAARAEAHGMERKAMSNFARENDGY
jgi:Ca-activated chloride channel family protein